GLTETQARSWIAWLTPEQRHTLLPTTTSTTTGVAPVVAAGVAGGGEWSGDDQAWFVDFLTALDKGTYQATPKGLYRFVTDEAADAADDDWMDETGHASAESDGLAPSAHAWLEKALQRLPAALQARTGPAASHIAPASDSSTGQDSVPAWNTWTSWNKTDTQVLQTFLTGIQSGLYGATLADADLYLTTQNPYQDFELRRGVRAWHWLGNAKTHSTYINSIRRNALSPEPGSAGDNWLAWLVTAAAEAWDETDEGLLHTFLDTTTNAHATPSLDDLQHFLDEQIPSDHPPRAGRWIHQARYSSAHAKTIITSHPDTTPTSTKASAWLTYLCNPTGPARPLPTTSNDGPPAKRRRTSRSLVPAVDLTTLNPRAVQTKLNHLNENRRWVVSGLMQGHDPAQIGTYRRYRTKGGGTDTAITPRAMGNQITLIGKALGLGTAPDALLADLVALGIGDPGTYDGQQYVAAHAREENDDAYVAKANTISADPTSPHRWFLSAILHGHDFNQIHQTLQADGTPKSKSWVHDQVDDLAIALGMPPDYTAERARATLLRLKSRINDPLTYSTAARDLDAALLTDTVIAERANALTDDRLRIALGAALSGESLPDIARTLQPAQRRGATTYSRNFPHHLMQDLGAALGLHLTAEQVREKIFSLKHLITNFITYDTSQRDLNDALQTDDVTVAATRTLKSPAHLRTLQAALDNTTLNNVAYALEQHGNAANASTALQSLGIALGLNDDPADILDTIQRLRRRIIQARTPPQQ
ncbi:hypothetical protein ABZT50_41930, partial [Streptomyces sp. NPDC005505]|uniref:hypothetical protein n=1 Tax=Streptomyces sp. NPDC005505 TaxID=3154884 RepID=UPI0033B8360B